MQSFYKAGSRLWTVVGCRFSLYGHVSDTPLLTRCEGLSSSSHNLRKWLLSVSLFTCGPVSLRSCDEGGCADSMSAQRRAHQRCSAFHVLKTTDEAPCCACSDFFFFLQLYPFHARLLNGDWWLHQEALLLWFRTADTAPDISAWMFFCFFFPQMKCFLLWGSIFRLMDLLVTSCFYLHLARHL